MLKSSLTVFARSCLYQPGPSNLTGEGNYIINVTENGKVVQSLILMDSGNQDTYGDGSGEETSAYAYIHYDQIEWYKWAIRNVSAQQYGSFDPASGKVSLHVHCRVNCWGPI